MRTEKSEVHSITGLFVEEHTPNQAKYFGGFISLRTSGDEPRQNVFAMPFMGSLVDVYGMSQISGEMSPAELRFQKTYAGRNNPIIYQLKKNEKGIWVGEYGGKLGIGNGTVLAKTNLDWANVEMIVPRPFDPEGWAKDLLEQMVDEEMLEIKRDEETGEEVVIPR